MDDEARSQRYQAVERAFQWPMAALTVAFVVAFAASLNRGLSETGHAIAAAVQWLAWAGFAIEYVVLLVLAPDRRRYVRTHLVELATVVLPALRVFRVLRALRLLRLVRLVALLAVVARGLGRSGRLMARLGLGYVIVVICLVLLGSSTAMLLIEGPSNGSLGTFSTCLWWSVVTMTTVGYGDLAPVTTAGRAVAMVLMLSGVTLMGVVTATIASVFVEIERSDNDRELRAQLEHMRAQLERVEARLRELGEGKDSAA